MTIEDPEPLFPSSMGSKIMDGAVWNTVQLMAARGTSLLVKLILARLLLPEDFGVVGMAAVFIEAIGAVSDLGLAAALIQFKREKISDLHLDTAFWGSLAFNGGIIALMVYVIGPFAAWFYNEPVLHLIVPVLGIAVIAKSASLIQRVTLTRELKFKPIGIAEASSALASGAIAIGLAFAGTGVWALILQDISYAIFSSFLLWRASSWRPHLHFSTNALSDILGAGLYDAGLRLITFLTKNVDYLLVGKFLGSELLGIYTLAFIITDTFRQQIWYVLSRVMFPVYAQIQHDTAKIKEYYLKVIKYNTIVITPIMILLIVFTKPIILSFFGEKWLRAEFPIQVMALAAIILTIGGTTGSVLRGIGRFDLTLRLSLVNFFIFTLPAFFIGIYYFGINGAAVAVLVYQVSSRVLFQLQMRKLVKVYELDILRALKIPFSGMLITSPLIVLSVRLFNSYDILILGAKFGLIGLCYCIAIYLIDKPEITRLLHLLAPKMAKPGRT